MSECHTAVCLKQMCLAVPIWSSMWSHVGEVKSDFRMIVQRRYVLCIVSYDHVGFLLEQVLGSSPHPHLFDDLLVQAGSLILQFAPSGLGERVATLR